MTDPREIEQLVAQVQAGVGNRQEWFQDEAHRSLDRLATIAKTAEERVREQQEWIDRVSEFSTDAATAADAAEAALATEREARERAEALCAEWCGRYDLKAHAERLEEAREKAEGERAAALAKVVLRAYQVEQAEARAERAEAERDSLLADSWRAYAESGADTDGCLKWHCSPQVAGRSLVDAVTELRRDYDESLDAAVRAERLEEALLTSYPAVPVDCLISELRDEFFIGTQWLTRERFEKRVAQFRGEVPSPTVAALTPQPDEEER